MKRLKTMGLRPIAMALALLLLLSLTTPALGIAAFAQDAASVISSAGDEHDDRPDDLGDRPDDAVGGDNATATTSISAEARAWAEAGGFDLTLFESYGAPPAHEPTADDIEAFENWMNGGSNPRNQVMKQIQGAAGEAIANELWNYCNTIWKGWMNTANVGSVVSKESGLKNVGAMQEGMFAGYFGSALAGGSTSGEEYGNAAALIKNGFVVSSDGATYRLHNMIDGTVAYEMPAPEGAVVSQDEFPEGLTSFTDFFPLAQQDASDEAKRLLAEYATAEPSNEPSSVDRAVYQAAAQYVNEKFGDYFGQCPGPTAVKGITSLGVTLDSVTEDTVGSSVGEKEFVASFFGTESAAASLWRLGFLPSFDGTTYRLHSGKDGAVVYSATAQELQEYLISTADVYVADASTADASAAAASTAEASGTSAWPYVGLGVLALLLIGCAVYVFRRKKRQLHRMPH